MPDDNHPVRAQLIFYMPGSNKHEYFLDFDLPARPVVGDLISIRRPDQEGTEDFIVRRVRWELHHTTNHQGEPPDQIGTVQFLIVECEYALSAHAMETHRRICENHEKNGGCSVVRF